jgi:GTPase SAR1 family protein
VNRPTSFQNIRDKWWPEIQHHCPNTPILLVGMKCDLRTQAPNANGVPFVTVAEGEDLAKRIGACMMGCLCLFGQLLCLNLLIGKYIECSALTTINLKTVFDDAIRAVMFPTSQKQKTGGFWKSSSKNNTTSIVDPEPTMPILPKGIPAPWIYPAESRIATDWGRLLDSPENADVRIDVGGECIHCNRVILARLV